MGTMHRFLPLLAALALFACDDDRAPTDGGSGIDAGGGVDAGAGGDAGTGCVSVMCELGCTFGFARDAAGCEICECAPEPDNSCSTPSDCGLAERPDCCSCVAGYADAQIDADPCLVRPGDPTPPGCRPDPEVCALVDCMLCESATSVACAEGVCAGERL